MRSAWISVAIVIGKEKDPGGSSSGTGFGPPGSAGDAPAPLAAPSPPGAAGGGHRSERTADQGRPSTAEAIMPPVEEHPIRLVVEDDLRRSRLTILFRLLLVIPHFIWLALWGIAVVFAAIVGWFAALFTGRLPDGFHRFLSAYVRYATHFYAYLYLAANPYPGFTGDPGYPVAVEIDEPRPQRRLVTLFRLILAIPAFVISSALTGALWTAAVFGWFASLALGRMPRGLRNVCAFAIHYTAQLDAYIYLLTDRYPYSGPVTGTEPEEEAAPEGAAPSAPSEPQAA